MSAIKGKKEKSLGEGEDEGKRKEKDSKGTGKSAKTAEKPEAGGKPEELPAAKKANKGSDDKPEANAATRKKVAGDDKMLRKDEKGRSLYQGPRGGVYYVNSAGNKVYVTPEKN